MITDEALDHECSKQLLLTQETAPETKGLSEFIWYYAQAYNRLTPAGVLFDDVRQAAMDAAFETPLRQVDDHYLPWAGAHLLLTEVGIQAPTLEHFSDIAENKKAFLPIYEKLPEKVDDELAESMEALFGAKHKGFGDLVAHHKRRTANIIACCRFYLFLLLHDHPATASGSFLAVAHTGIRFMMEGSAVIKYFERYKRAV